MKIAALDDDPLFLKSLESLFHFSSFSGNLSLSCFTTSTALLASSLEEFDAFFLDIFLANESGIMIARSLQARLRNPLIIFMTSSREEAVDAFALGALHYLVKPLEQAQVDAALKRVNDKQVFDQKKLILPNRDGQIVIRLSQIHYIESFGNYKDIKTDEGVISVRKSTSEVLDWLQGDPRFYPLSRSFIVNFDFVKSLKADGLLLTSGELLPFPRDKKKAISAAFLSYIRA